MKTKFNAIFFAFIMLFAIGQTMAQSPDAFNYQAVARDAAGDVLANQAIGIKVSLHNGSAAGAVDYSETFTPTTNEFGLFTLSIGTGTPVTGQFDTLHWDAAQYWLQVEMDPAGGVSYADMGTSQLLSVPYAMYASKGVWEKMGTSAVYMDGRVGIGSTSPSAALDVVRNDNNTNSQIWVKQTGTGDASIGFNTPAGSWGIATDQDDLGKLKIGNSAFASTSPQMTFDMNGHIGMGTTTPNSTSKLHVASSNRYAGYFTSDSASSLAHAVHGEYTAASNDGSGVYGKATPADYYGYGGYFEGGYRGVYGRSIGTSGGYAGVYGYASSTGTGAAYGVYGSATAATGTPYGVYCSGNGGYTGTWLAVSDAKFKKDIVNYNGALENIMKLRPVSYSMKTDEYPFMGFSSGLQIGFIAQEVKEIFPTLVEKGAHPGAEKEDAIVEYMGMNYIGMVPVLVAGMQEQQQQIELLKQQIELLKQEVELLKK
ncbi:MAG TPA: tail fiber domain-containing protein [Bacteroidales bacterium]|nr:tail fiber domain-containing protein [Bacteroidales bacterium]